MLWLVQNQIVSENDMKTMGGGGGGGHLNFILGFHGFTLVQIS